MIQLYTDSQFASPYAMSVFIALVEKALPFKVVTLDLAAQENTHPEYARTSLTQRVPTLVDGQFTLSESSAITEYLNEVYPGPLLYPWLPTERARARQIQAWLRSDLMALRQERSTEVIFYRQTSVPLTPSGRADVQKLIAVASELLSPGEENLFQTWCIADVDLSLMLNRLVMNGDAIPAFLEQYAHRQWQRESIQRWINQPRPPL
jgi:glutathione S-transferase